MKPLGLVSIEELKQAILEYLRADIASHGGTGRRLPKIALGIGVDVTVDWEAGRFGSAIHRLERDGAIRLEAFEIGFIYAILPDAEANWFTRSEAVPSPPGEDPPADSSTRTGV